MKLNNILIYKPLHTIYSFRLDRHLDRLRHFISILPSLLLPPSSLARSRRQILHVLVTCRFSILNDLS